MPDKFTLLIVDLYSSKVDDQELNTLLTEFEKTGNADPLDAVAVCESFNGPTLDNCYSQAFHANWTADGSISTWHDRDEI